MAAKSRLPPILPIAALAVTRARATAGRRPARLALAASACSAAMRNCDGNVANGCEVNTRHRCEPTVALATSVCRGTNLLRRRMPDAMHWVFAAIHRVTVEPESNRAMFGTNAQGSCSRESLQQPSATQTTSTINGGGCTTFTGSEQLSLNGTTRLALETGRLCRPRSTAVIASTAQCAGSRHRFRHWCNPPGAGASSGKRGSGQT